MGMDELRNREYNGWENRWTWLVHLHLSNDQALFLEIAQLVATEPDDVLAGRLVEAWVKSAITRWMNRFSGYDRRFDGDIALLTWDLLGAALAYTEWGDLVTLLSGGEQVTNVFTATLNHRLRQLPQLQAPIAEAVHRASSLVGAADALKAWFEALLVEWIDQVAVGQQGQMPVAMVFSGLLHNVYDLVVWEHVARAFRPEY
jgi:hypothetical protein